MLSPHHMYPVKSRVPSALSPTCSRILDTPNEDRPRLQMGLCKDLDSEGALLSAIADSCCGMGGLVWRRSYTMAPDGR